MSSFVRWRRTRQPRRNKMKIAVLSTSVIFLLAFSTGFVDAAPPKSTPAAHAAAQPPQLDVAYVDLGKYLGKRINVRSTLDTIRSGILTKYSATSINIKLDGGAELTMPAETIRSASVPVPPPDPLYPATGDSSAKKN
jgi:hypothetical protein